jgi:hypothetical protein
LEFKIQSRIFPPPTGGNRRDYAARELIVRAINELDLFFLKKTHSFAKNMDVDGQLPKICRKFNAIFPHLTEETIKQKMGQTDHDAFAYFGRVMNILQEEFRKLPDNITIKISSGPDPLKIVEEKEVSDFFNNSFLKSEIFRNK